MSIGKEISPEGGSDVMPHGFGDTPPSFLLEQTFGSISDREKERPFSCKLPGFPKENRTIGDALSFIDASTDKGLADLVTVALTREIKRFRRSQGGV